MIAAPDGSGVRSLLKEPLTDVAGFDSSPDSRSLAVVHKVNGVRVLSIVDIEHGTMRTLDVNGLAVDYWVAWLPGTTSELLFGSRSGSGDSERAGIYSIQADGSGLTPVVPSEMGPAEYKQVDLAPDGRTLTYWRWESATLPGRIHQLDIATKIDREFRFDPSAYGETGLVHSPDGSQVLLSRNGTDIGPDHDRPGRRQSSGHPRRASFEQEHRWQRIRVWLLAGRQDGLCDVRRCCAAVLRRRHRSGPRRSVDALELLHMATAGALTLTTPAPAADLPDWAGRPSSHSTTGRMPPLLSDLGPKRCQGPRPL